MDYLTLFPSASRNPAAVFRPAGGTEIVSAAGGKDFSISIIHPEQSLQVYQLLWFRFLSILSASSGMSS